MMSMRCRAYDIALPDATKLRDAKALKEIGDNATDEVVKSAAAKALNALSSCLVCSERVFHSLIVMNATRLETLYLSSDMMAKVVGGSVLALLVIFVLYLILAMTGVFGKTNSRT